MKVEQTLGVLIDAAKAQETPADDPIDTEDSELGPEEIAAFDLDGDAAASPWELEEVLKLIERAEDHPLKNDRGDAAYPIERDEYTRAWEFEALDINDDGSIDAPEYYLFLFDTLQQFYRLDANGDRGLSPSESGLSGEQFEVVDRNGSGLLQVWEIRRGVGRGVWKRQPAIP